MILLYIDPGTGSMLFSLFIGITMAATFALHSLFLKIKFMLLRGKSQIDEKNIPFVIFSDHKRYWNIFEPICNEFEKRKIPLVYYTASADDPALEKTYQHISAQFIGEGNKAFSRLNFLNADIVISTTPGLEVYQWKRSKNAKLYVHIPHSVDDLAGYRMFALDYYDAVLTNGKNQKELIRTIESLRPKIKRKEIFCTGSIPLDNLKNRYESSTRIQNEKKTVLVAPSWGKNGILSRYGKTFLKALSQTDFHIIVRPHPQTVQSEQNILKPLMENFSDFEWNFDNDNFNVLNRADILISDFSGIIFDFSLVFKKPVIFTDTNFDTLPYDADWLSEETWNLKVLPLLGCKLQEEDFPKLQSIIQEVLENKTIQEGRKKVTEECWQHQGKSAELCTDWLIQTHESLKSHESFTTSEC